MTVKQIASSKKKKINPTLCLNKKSKSMNNLTKNILLVKGLSSRCLRFDKYFLCIVHNYIHILIRFKKKPFLKLRTRFINILLFFFIVLKQTLKENALIRKSVYEPKLNKMTKM